MLIWGPTLDSALMTILFCIEIREISGIRFERVLAWHIFPIHSVNSVSHDKRGQFARFFVTCVCVFGVVSHYSAVSVKNCEILVWISLHFFFLRNFLRRIRAVHVTFKVLLLLEKCGPREVNLLLD